MPRSPRANQKAQKPFLVNAARRRLAVGSSAPLSTKALRKDFSREDLKEILSSLHIATSYQDKRTLESKLAKLSKPAKSAPKSQRTQSKRKAPSGARSKRRARR